MTIDEMNKSANDLLVEGSPVTAAMWRATAEICERLDRMLGGPGYPVDERDEPEWLEVGAVEPRWGSGPVPIGGWYVARREGDPDRVVTWMRHGEESFRSWYGPIPDEPAR